jgi:Cof subfamily protein (haloacid dehalogenase superfamily)
MIPFPIRPEAIAFDLDGTLLDHDGVLADSVLRAVRRIADSGIRVFIVTGRLTNSAVRVWRALGLDTPLACCNGACAGYPGEEPFHHVRLGAAERNALVDIDIRTGIHINYAIDDVVYSLKDGPERSYYSRTFSPVSLAAGPGEILSRNLPTKCLAITSEEDQPAALDLIRNALGDGAEITTSNKRFVEIMPPNVNKGVGLDVLARWLGAAPAAFAAAGDAMNDLPMLQKAGHSISFTNADPRVREQVGIVLPPLWEGGCDELVRDVLGIRE